MYISNQEYVIPTTKINYHHQIKAYLFLEGPSNWMIQKTQQCWYLGLAFEHIVWVKACLKNSLSYVRSSEDALEEKGTYPDRSQICLLSSPPSSSKYHLDLANLREHTADLHQKQEEKLDRYQDHFSLCQMWNH